MALTGTPSRLEQHRRPQSQPMAWFRRTTLIIMGGLSMVGAAAIIIYASTAPRTLIPMALAGGLGLGIMLVWFLRFGSGFTAAWFLAFMALTILFNRQFAHIAIPRPPLYVTEATMGLVTVLLWVRRDLKVPRSMRKWLIWVALVMAAGIVLNATKFGWLPVLRDSAELYYVWMVPLSYSVLRLTGPHIRRVHIEWGLASAAWLVPVVYFVTRHSQLPADSETVCGMLMVAVLVWDWRTIPSLLMWPTVALELIMVLHWGARGPWVGLGLGAVILLWLLKDSQAETKARVLRRSGLTLGLLVWGGLVLWTVDPHLLGHLTHDIASLTTTHGSYSQVANNRWRLIIWTEALHQFMGNPLAIRVGQAWFPVKLIALGYGGWNASIGFGLNTVAVSNSYIQMLQWYGIWAIVGMAGIVCGGLRRIFGPRTTAQMLVLCFLAMWAVVTGVEVVLEGPYMSSIIWCLIGFCYYYPEWQTMQAVRQVAGHE